MPALITHQIFARQIFEKLESSQKNKVSQKDFEIFSQSHDYFYYYHNYNVNQTKEINKFGKYVHKSNSQSYIINIIRNIRKNHLGNNKQAIAFLYGAISHYILDSTTHPYIFYYSGCYNPNIPESKKYQGKHNQMERHIDCYLYQKFYQKNINQLNIRKEILPNTTITKEVVDLINQSYKDTYNKPRIAPYFLKGISHAQIYFSLFTQDRYGIKKGIYSTISSLSYRNKEILANYSYHIKNINLAYLNLEHHQWHHPCTNEIFTTSFEDLFDEAIAKTLNIINYVNKVLYNDEDYRNLVNIIPNYSYITGLPITNNKPLKYFTY